jgi:hypothetical protein
VCGGLRVCVCVAWQVLKALKAGKLESPVAGWLLKKFEMVRVDTPLDDVKATMLKYDGRDVLGESVTYFGTLRIPHHARLARLRAPKADLIVCWCGAVCVCLCLRLPLTFNDAQLSTTRGDSSVGPPRCPLSHAHVPNPSLTQPLPLPP